MIDYEFFDLFNADSIDKQFYIEYSGGLIANTELFEESVEITESLCSESSLRFGCCEASSLKFKVGNVYNLPPGTELTVSVVLSEDKNDPFINNARVSDRFLIGKYIVDSSVLTADKMWREVTAYDAMYKIINTDVANWYNSVLPDDSSQMKLKEFRKKFSDYFGIPEFLPEGGLVNDDMTVTRTIVPEQISGRDVLTAICEINGCFGHIGRDGNLHYVYLDRYIQGLYPANELYPDHAPDNLLQSKTGHLYPQDPKYVSIGQNKNYVNLDYDDFITEEITKLQIRDEENSAGTLYPPGKVSDSDNCYTIQGNFLVYGKSDAEMQIIAEHIYGKITGIVYRPFNLKVRANPCAEVGDSVRVSTDFHIVESYIMQRTMKGLQAFMDTISAFGTKKYTENVNSVQSAIEQLKGKTNTLTRTAEETRSELKDLEESAESRFVQTAEKIEAEVTRATAAEGVLTTNLSITAEGLRSEVTRAQGAEANLSSEIAQTASEIQMEVSARQGDIADVRASLSLKIDKDDDGTIISLIEGSADRIHFNANNMFRVTSPNFTIDESGNVDIGGVITAYGALYLDARLFPSGSPKKVNVLNAKTSVYTHYESRGSRPKGIYSYSAGSSELAPILEIGKDASVVITDKQFQSASIYSPEGLFAECIMTYADIANLWLMSSTDGTYGGTVYQCNGSYGNEGIASPGWVKNYVANSMPSVDLSGYMRRNVNILAGTQTVSMCLRNAYVSSNGGIEFTLQSINTSDARLKNIGKKLDDVAFLYMNLVPEEFSFKSGMPGYDSSILHFGVDAQATIKAMEIAGINPSDYCLVFEEEPTEIFGDTQYVNDKVLKVDYNEFHGLHIAMIQKQQKEIDELKRENIRLSGEIEILNQRMEELLNAINHKDN